MRTTVHGNEILRMERGLKAGMRMQEAARWLQPVEDAHAAAPPLGPARGTGFLGYDYDDDGEEEALEDDFDDDEEDEEDDEERGDFSERARGWVVAQGLRAGFLCVWKRTPHAPMRTGVSALPSRPHGPCLQPGGPHHA